ncbi:hypothetical protein [Taklimakanibacter deserti]|uniref:hypothetical protein n=1 Tax=Taklimakanibacter deserti TaxID=2267839 RepID=UPI0013C4D726
MISAISALAAFARARTIAAVARRATYGTIAAPAAISVAARTSISAIAAGGVVVITWFSVMAVVVAGFPISPEWVVCRIWKVGSWHVTFSSVASANCRYFRQIRASAQKWERILRRSGRLRRSRETLRKKVSPLVHCENRSDGPPDRWRWSLNKKSSRHGIIQHPN